MRHIFVIIPLICIAAGASCQELAKVVNSPKALRIEAEVAQVKAERDPTKQEYFLNKRKNVLAMGRRKKVEEPRSWRE